MLTAVVEVALQSVRLCLGRIYGSVLVKMIRILNYELKFKFHIACFDDKTYFSVFLQVWVMPCWSIGCGERLGHVKSWRKVFIIGSESCLLRLGIGLRDSFCCSIHLSARHLSVHPLLRPAATPVSVFVLVCCCTTVIPHEDGGMVAFNGALFKVFELH